MTKRIDTWLPITFGVENMVEVASQIMEYVVNKYENVLFNGIFRVGCAYCVVFYVNENQVGDYINDLSTTFPDIKTEESRGFRPSV